MTGSPWPVLRIVPATPAPGTRPFLALPGWRGLRDYALLAALLTAWFCLVYGGADALTARRSLRVPVHFAAELAIPFVPAFAWAYMSIYAIFLLVPFVLRSRDEQRALALTLAAVIALGGLCFLLLPAELAYPPPPIDATTPGLTAAVFRLADRLNLDYNLLPSLHVALSTACAAVFARHAHRVGRLLLWSWALSVAASTLLTHQHHLLDALTGFLLALAAVRWLYDRLVPPDGG